MRHESLPLSMTNEQLADYIQSNKINTQNHVEKFPLTEEERHTLALKSSNASRQIVRLENLLKDVRTMIMKGTPWDWNIGKNGDNAPYDFTIPPTAGINTLKANRLHVDGQLEKGYREEVTTIYFLPWPEFERIIAVDITGNEWTTYSRPMTASEIKQHGKPILSASQDVKEIMEKSGLEVETVQGKTVGIRKKKDTAISKQPPLSEDEREELKKEEPPVDEDKPAINLLDD